MGLGWGPPGRVWAAARWSAGEEEPRQSWVQIRPHCLSLPVCEMREKSASLIWLCWTRRNVCQVAGLQQVLTDGSQKGVLHNQGSEEIHAVIKGCLTHPLFG